MLVQFFSTKFNTGLNNPGIKGGIISGCPFCKARVLDLPSPGNLIRFLTGYEAGLVGRVVNKEIKEFSVHFDKDPPFITQRVIIGLDLFEYMPPVSIPRWALPISLRGAAELDELVINFCERSFSKNKWVPDRLAFYALIQHIWHLRLPIEPFELWEFLEAHGVQGKWKKRLMQLYSDCIEMLIFAIGRKPIKKKKVSPLST